MSLAKRLLLFFGILGIILAIPIALISWATKVSLKELPQESIGPWFVLMTGRDLPHKVEDLRAVLYKSRGYQLFYTFKTDEEGCSYILEVFGGPDVQIDEFAEGEFEEYQLQILDRIAFFQKDLGIILFNPKQITGPGYHLYYKYRAQPSAAYEVLIDKGNGKVYIFAES
jgi:hypothetical protein